MPNRILTIEDFSAGMLDDITEQSGNGFNVLSEMDIFSNPGILRPSIEVADETASAVDLLITAIDNYDGDGTDKLYGFDGAKVYQRTGTTWSVDRTLSGTTALTDTPEMVTWNNAVWYATKSDIGKLATTTYDDDYLTTVISGALPAQDAAWKPMRAFLDKLFIGDGRYISSIDTSETFTAQELVLPEGYRIRCLEVINDRLAIACGGDSATTGDPSKTTVFIWDGTSANPESIVEVNSIGGVQSIKNVDNILYLFARNTAPPAPAGIDIYFFNGADFELLKTVVNSSGETDSVRMYCNAVENFNNDLIFGTTNDSGSGHRHGVWKYGKVGGGSKGRALALDNLLPSDEASDVTIGAIKTFGNQYFFSYQEGANYKVAALSTTVANDGYVESQIYETNRQSFKSLIQGIQVFAKTMPASTNVVVKYDVDRSGSWTTLGTITSAEQADILYGIYKRADTIQFRWEFTSNNLNFPEVYKFEIY